MDGIWIIPPALALIGLFLFCSAVLVSRRFDRKHPELSRKGMRALEDREKARPTAARR